MLNNIFSKKAAIYKVGVKVFFMMAVVSVIVGCKTTTEQLQKTDLPEKQISQQLVNAILWYRNSAEMRMLYYQSYHYGKILLDQKLNKADGNKKSAIVLDIDETVLDNSPFEVKRVETGSDYSSEGWKKWTDQAMAEALPGALDFVKYAETKDVAVFYISNRSVSELPATLKNLKSKGFPNADESHVMLREKTGDKTKRRSIIEKDYEILLFAGDNLTDFSQKFADRGSDFGFTMVDKYKDELLENFIMLPNPMYGEWEKAIYDNNYGMPGDEKLKRRDELLKSEY